MPNAMRRILLAEDSRFFSKAYELVLRRAGYSVISVADGEQALHAARTAHPDLIILDMLLPKMQGVDVLRVLKEDPATSAIPIVVVSGLSQDNEDKLMTAGAAGHYEKKNAAPEQLAEIVQRALANCSVRARAEFRSSPELALQPDPAGMERR